MATERWQQTEDIYHTAIGPPETQRKEQLAEPCGGDDELRTAADTLLTRHAQADEVTESLSLTTDPIIGRRVGAYRLVREVGRGGMGAVFLGDGVYTIPEISVIGKTERQLTEAKITHEVGVAKYEELARGQILGDQTGKLKLLFGPRSLKLLGLHIIGEGATELIHIGQAILNMGATIEYFRDTVFNYPTLA